jgi:hypothetical protein
MSGSPKVVATARVGEGEADVHALVRLVVVDAGLTQFV